VIFVFNMSPAKQFIRHRFTDDWITPSSSEDSGTTVRMNPDSNSSPKCYEHVSLEDQAALLLSVASIARSEFISGHGSTYSTNSLTCSLGPTSSIPDKYFLTPRSDPRNIIQSSALNTTIGVCTPSPTRLDFNRARTVSIDSPLPSVPPLSMNDSIVDKEQLERLMAPFTPHGYLIRTDRPNVVRARIIDNDDATAEINTEIASISASPDSPKTVIKANALIRSNKKLQSEPPKGTRVKKIVRRKFSWKNYPEVRYMV
jgi:hypothetical protein